MFNFKNVSKYSLSMLVICLSAITSGKVNASCKKVMSWNEESPFVFSIQKNQAKEWRTDTLRDALMLLDCQLSLQPMSWARGLVDLEQGRIDMVGEAYKTDQRQEIAWFSNIPMYSATIIFVRVEDLGKYHLSQLSDIVKYNLKVGTQINAVYGDEFSKMLQEPNFSALIYPNPTRSALWKMLHLGRIDSVISEQRTGLLDLKNLNLDKMIAPTQFVVSSQASFIMFSKRSTSKEFVAAFDRALLQVLSAQP